MSVETRRHLDPYFEHCDTIISLSVVTEFLQGKLIISMLSVYSVMRLDRVWLCFTWYLLIFPLSWRTFISPLWG